MAGEEAAAATRDDVRVGVCLGALGFEAFVGVGVEVEAPRAGVGVGATDVC